jgi:hypothetical protein
MDEVQKHDSYKCNTPSPEDFRSPTLNAIQIEPYHLYRKRLIEQNFGTQNYVSHWMFCVYLKHVCAVHT